ncbi:MAG: hypothetical protein ACPHQT_02105 [Planctomycetota bacterium]
MARNASRDRSGEEAIFVARLILSAVRISCRNLFHDGFFCFGYLEASTV